MALCIGRFASSKQLSCAFRNVYFPSCRTVGLKATPALPPSSETFDERNARLKRPQSPHITIYRFPLPAVMSITHRITGMALGGYLTALGLGSLITPVDFPFLAESIANMHLPGALVVTGKALLAYPAAYHFVNGFRHLIWDTGRLLSMKEVYTTGYITLGVAVLFTAWLVCL